jgi:hypothetical protein
MSDWVDLDYFDRPRPLRRLWRWALVVALMGAALYVGWAVVFGSPTAFQAGPVSTAHAMFNHDCKQCHVNAFQTFGRLWRFDSDVRSVPDAACTKCHSEVIHHATMVGKRSCASCHREHRGRSSLARVDDLYCTSCHADLKRNDGKPTEFHPHVTAFTPGRHPEFKLFAAGEPTDPGHIKFNHKKHLVEDGVWTMDAEQVNAQKKKTIELGSLPAFDITKELKQRKKLDCQDCHRFDEAGRFMQPIRYEQHCKECHPLGVQLLVPREKEEKEKRLHTLALPFSEEAAPHPAPTQTPDVVRGTLRDRLARFIEKKENQVFLDSPAAGDVDRSVPGTPPLTALSREQHAWVNQQLGLVERLLFEGAGGCQFCHEKTNPVTDPGRLPEFAPSAINSRWFVHAVFSHKSHDVMSCTTCHKKQDGGNVADSETAKDVLLPRLASCLECHTAGGGRARSDCVECHIYHHPEKDAPVRGRRTIQELLRH